VALTVEDVVALAPVIPVVVVDNVEHAVPLAEALVRGGLPAIEVTLRTDAALGAIERIAAEVPDARVGAGTVLTPAQGRAALAAGAQFLVAPGTTAALLDGLAEAPLLPGATTASEVMMLLERGIEHAKFFPAETSGGIAALRALAGPFPQMRFCPTGGIDAQNAREYLALPNVACVGGTWMLDQPAASARRSPRTPQATNAATSATATP
jgi:2-dehydro-3-deoxyphosphogluconate aldolase / (4S)-4-hydroxy-2-oxoglutarate aldolase